MQKFYGGNCNAGALRACNVFKINSVKRALLKVAFLISCSLAWGHINSSPLKPIPSNYFRSANSGDWSAASSWESSVDSVGWAPATTAPDNNAKSIVIRSTHTITLTANATAKLLTIESGGILTSTNVSVGGYSLAITDDGTSAPDFTIYGTYILFGIPPLLKGSATATVYPGGLVRADGNIGSGSEAFASSPSVLFKTGAVFEWNNNIAFATKKVTYFRNSTADIPIFRISQTTSVLGATDTTTFNGILEIDSNTLFSGSGLKIFRDGIAGSATLTLESSTKGYNITSSNAILGGTLQLILNDNLRLLNGVTVPNEANVKVTSPTQDGFLKSAGSFLVNGIIDLSDVTISNTSGDVTINGTLKTSRSNGLYYPGNVAGGSIIINDGSTIEYNGSNQDITSSTKLNGLYYNIVFSGSGTKNPLGKIDVNTNGSVKITGASVVVDASSNNIGSTSVNGTDFIMDGGRLILGTGGTQPNMDGDYFISGGVVEFAGSSAKSIRSRAYQNIEITGSNVGNSTSYITLNDLGTFTVKSGGVFSINDNSINGPAGTQTVTVEADGVFKCGNNEGFNGFTSTFTDNSSVYADIENIILADGSTVEYTRSGDQPITNANGLIYSNLTLSGSGNKMAPRDGLIIKGNFAKTTNSIFIHNNDTVIFSGSGTQLYSSASPRMVFYNVTNNNAIGLYINDSLYVYKELLLGPGSKINLNAGITLLSDKNNTANVAPIPDNATINYTGLFTVERYIPGHSKAWQFLATPTKGQTINGAWQEGNNPGGNSKPGYGTQITSNLPNATDLGFDMTSVNPSMKTYNSLTGGWEGVLSTYLGITNAKGYMLFVRGDRSVTSVNQPATATILRTTGKLFSPGIEAPPTINVSANSFTSVGNPYASAINFDQLTFSGDVEEAYYVWDPQLTSGPYSAYGFGGYRAISHGVVAPASGNYADENNIPAIQSGQAFFVYGMNGGTIGFKESSKVSSSASIFRTAGALTKAAAQLRLNLSTLNNGDTVLLDGVVTQFDAPYSNELDALDALKIANSGENLSIVSNAKNISIERRQTGASNDTLFYNLTQMKQQQYQFKFIASHLDHYGTEPVLEDNYLHTQIPLNTEGSTVVNFTVNNVAASSGNDRFHIVFGPSGPLPVMFNLIRALRLNNHIIVEWEIENESNMLGYTIEKSSDGKSFIFANGQEAKNAPSATYHWVDENPFNGFNYYRVKSIALNGEIKYSQVVYVNTVHAETSVSVYPNSLVNNTMNVQFTGMPAGNYQISLLNSLGQKIISRQIKHKGGSSSEIISLPPNLPHGIYQLEIIEPGNNKRILKITK